MQGKLFIVSTPIGNLEDITYRAINTLNSVDIIGCEDTRVSKKLIKHLKIKKELSSYHEFNEIEKAKKLLNKIKGGKNVAVISDAGTPTISDPGFRIVQLAIKENIEVIHIPGPSAVLSALAISGISPNSFLFLGFPPKTKKKLIDFLNSVKECPHTLIIFDSPKRIVKTLNYMIEVLGDRNISVCRELTKMYEESIRGKITDVLEKLSHKESIKGEITVVVEGAKNSKDTYNIENVRTHLSVLRQQGYTLKDSIKLLSQSIDIPKKTIYRTALDIWSD